MTFAIQIGGRTIGAGEPLFVIAEIGLNHGGSIGRALDLVDAAAAAGASAVKVQALVARDLVAPDCAPPAHVKAESLRDFFAAFELSGACYEAIAARARACGLAFVATPFSLDAVHMLERIGVDAYKIASGDITYDGLIETCARTGKPLVISTGMSELDEIENALVTATCAGAEAIALLHCVSSYPVPHGSENLRAIATLGRFGWPVGLSDHAADAFAASLGVTAGMALGASLYERHLELDDDGDCLDHAVSSTTRELAELVTLAADTQAALGNGAKTCLAAESVNRDVSRRALRAARALRAGDIVRAADVVALRPAVGLAPSRERDLIGTCLTRDIGEGEPFLAADLAPRGDCHEAA